MSINYGLYNSLANETVLGYFPASPRSYSGGAVVKSISTASGGTSVYDITGSGFQLSNNQLSLNSSEPTEAAVPNLLLNNYGQLTFLLSTAAQTIPGDKKGAFFGISQGSSYYRASTLNHTEDGHIAVNTLAIAGIDTTIGYTQSSQSVYDVHVSVPTTAVTGTSGGVDTTVAYTSSTQQTLDPRTAVSTVAFSGVDTTVAYTSSTQTTTDISINTTTITGTQFYADLPEKELLLKLDRGSRGLYAKLKDTDGETSLSTSLEPSEKDVVGVVFEKSPYNRVSIYVNGSLAGSSTTTTAISSFPTNSTGLRIFANGVSTDCLDGSIGSLMMFSRKLSDTEISRLSSNIKLQGAL